MSRKHYEVFARMLDNACLAARRQHTDQALCDVALGAIRDLTVDIAIAFGDDNARFDRQRFYQACADANPALRD